jgi:hypothetical protein
LTIKFGNRGNVGGLDRPATLALATAASAGASVKSPVYGAAPDKSGLAGFIRRCFVARRFIFGGHGITEFECQNS